MRLLSHWLKDTFAATCIDGPLPGHRFGTGAATVAVRAGIPDHIIQAMGRWARTCNANQLYIQTPEEALAKVTPLLSNSPLVSSPCLILSHKITDALALPVRYDAWGILG